MIFRPPKPRNLGVLWAVLGISAGVTVFVVLLLAGTLRSAANLEYRLTPTHVIIDRGRDAVQIARSEIVAVELIEEPTGAFRRFGTSAPGVKTGSWYFDQTGPITLWATTYRPLVVIETRERKFGVSPADPEAFIQALRDGAGGNFPPVSVEGGRSGLITLSVVLSLLTVGATGFLAVYLLRLVRSMGYELGPDHLVIRGGLRPVRIPYKEITAVERKEPQGSPLRIAGSNLPGLYWGKFSWSAVGPNLKLYATRLSPLVVVRAGKRVLGLSPEDEDRFVQELSKRIPRHR